MERHKNRFHTVVSKSTDCLEGIGTSKLNSVSVVDNREFQIRSRMNEYQIIFEDTLRTGEIVKSALRDTSVDRESLPKDLRKALDLYESNL